MFSSKKQLIKRTGKSGVGRFSFLQQLINEYTNTKSRDAKEQVLANLANFAYDPVNYDYLWRLKVLDVFFSALNEQNKKLVIYGISGICNICLEPNSREYIIKNNGIQIISSLLSRAEEPVILSAITILIYLNDSNSPDIRQAIGSPQNKELMLKCSKSTNQRIKNLAIIFLQDLYGLKISGNQITITNSSTSSISVPSESSCEPGPSTSSACENKSAINKKKDTKVPRIVMNL